MKTNIFIPKQINVGFQNRSDTYTKKLAYVIYFDEKGKLRKEASWNSWRDKQIESTIFENESISGFVLNKKVGDYASDWNHRQAYVRVYDPRDFEFEITIENLLYILENASSIKGKGLEGDFVYGWEGKDLVLIPVESPDYIEISKYNTILHQKDYIKSKDLILGAKYKTKQNEEYIYMGRFDYHDYKYEKVKNPNWNGRNYYGEYIDVNVPVNKGKHYFFAHFYRYDHMSSEQESYLSFKKLKSLGDKLIETMSSECVENYAEIFEKLECDTDYSPYDASKDEIKYYTLEELTEKFSNGQYQSKRIHYNKNDIIVAIGFDYDSEKNVYYLSGAYNYCDRRYNRIFEGTIQDILVQYKPTYKNEYLQNGKFYRRLP